MHLFSSRTVTLFAFLLLYIFSGCKKQKVIEEEPKETPPVINSVLIPVKTPVSSIVDGYYVILPSNYQQSAETFPLMIFTPGAGQFGNGFSDLPLLLKDGPAQIADEKKFPGTFTVNGKKHSLIVFTPQFKRYPSSSEINECIKFAKRTYRIDTSRVYLSGLSIGGIETSNLGAEIPSKIAAIVPMAGVFPDYATTEKCRIMAQSNLPVWLFHSADDPLIPLSTINGFVSKFNSYNPAIVPKLTVWPNGGHDAWTRAIDPLYKKDGMNIYEWMLQYKR